jgi:hypothetical protein
VRPLAAEILQLCLEVVSFAGDSDTVQSYRALQQQFFRHYYKYYQIWLAKQLFGLVVGAAQSAELSAEPSAHVCAMLVAVLKVLVQCVKQHGGVVFEFIARYNVCARVLPLLKCKTREVQVSSCIQCNMPSETTMCIGISSIALLEVLLIDHHSKIAVVYVCASS